MRIVLVIALLSFAARAAAEPGACQEDAACPGKEICERGRCRLPRAAEPPPRSAPATGRGKGAILARPAEGELAPEVRELVRQANERFRACNADAECGTDLCVDRQCSNPAAAPPARRDPTVNLGLYYLSAVGIAGGLRNPVPSSSIGLEISTPGVARYHFAAGYTNLNGFHGVLLAPLDWGFAIPLSKGKLDVYLEPVLEPWKLELFAAGKFLAFTVSSAIDLPAVVEVGPAYFTLSPIGVEVRYLTLAGRSGEGGIAPDNGLNWRLRLGAGLRL